MGAAVNTGDMAYDDTNLHMRLFDLNRLSASQLPAYHTQKQHANKEVWLEIQVRPDYPGA